MSMTVEFQLTVAGVNQAFYRAGQALDLQITHAQLGSGNQTPNGNEVALLVPKEAHTISGHFDVSEYQHRISVAFPGAAIASYPISEIGLWSGDPSLPGSVLVFYWSVPSGSYATKPINVAFDLECDINFGTVTPGNITIVADTQFNALAMLAQHASEIDPHGLAVPLQSLPYPTVDTANNRLVITGATGTNGGSVSFAGGDFISIGRSVISGKTGLIKTVPLSAYSSADLDVNSTYYLRAAFINGVLTTYVQKGTDTDAEPAGLVGTPNAASGGGFDTTVLDALLAKIVTGSAGSAPVVTPMANSSRLTVHVSVPTDLTLGSGGYFTHTINWGHTPRSVTFSAIGDLSGPTQTTDVQQFISSNRRQITVYSAGYDAAIGGGYFKASYAFYGIGK